MRRGCSDGRLSQSEILKYHYHPRPDSDPFTAANSDTTPLYIQKALLGSLGWHMYREAAWTQLWETITLVTKCARCVCSLG